MRHVEVVHHHVRIIAFTMPIIGDLVSPGSLLATMLNSFPEMLYHDFPTVPVDICNGVHPSEGQCVKFRASWALWADRFALVPKLQVRSEVRPGSMSQGDPCHDWPS